MKWLVWGIVLLIIPAVFAQEGTIRLLALSELSNGSNTGMVADLDLKIVQGNNKVFLETFPLTKITTQVSLRLAQQVACKELDIDCSDKDFFFTIRAMPGIVGGPSAGSAAAVLSASLLGNLKLRNDTAITGTINSGGIIGPVGGVKEKMEAAASAGMKRVLIPRGTKEIGDNTTNSTTDLVAYGKQLGLEVIEVSTLGEALHEYTGKDFTHITGELVLESNYLDTMKQVAQDLCERTNSIKLLLDNKRSNISNTTNLEDNAANMSGRAQDAFAVGQYYASASFCFRANVNYKRALALQRNWAEKQLAKALLELRALTVNFSQEVDAKQINTITDLQTYMAVKERLFEVEDAFVEIVQDLNDTKTNAERLAYAEERLFSAATWARFFDGKSEQLKIDTKSLRDSCTAKISEAEERINYVQSFLPTALRDSRRELDKAYQDLSTSNYTLCFFKAAKVKAEADVILNLVGVEEKELDDLLKLKLDIVKEAIMKTQLKGIFPIIGYSYYEYATSLTDLDKYSSLLFSEYALELSNLDLYFPKKNGKNPDFWTKVKPHLTWVLSGMLIGVILATIVDTVQRMRKQKRHKR